MAEGPDPFQGHVLSGEGVTRGGPIKNDAERMFGGVESPTDDPAWQPPSDPLNGKDVKAQAYVINRELPVVVAQTGWTIKQVRFALIQLVAGLFDQPAQLIDSIVGDSRVQSSLASLSGGLFSRPIKFSAPEQYKDDDRAKECLGAWQRVWPNLATESVLSEFMQWDSLMGWALGQLLWDTTDPELWIPHLQPWHPRYTYYQWMIRRYVAITMDGQVPIEPGNGHWVLHTPHGPYRGWMRGAVRAVAPWWLSRNFALRDASRFSERHGFPITKAKTPAGADPQAIDHFRRSLMNLGQESVVQLPQSHDKDIESFDIDYLEAKDQSWEVFFRLIEQCNAEIALAFQGQNLTSEVKEGSLAAARVHGDVRQSILAAKARAFSRSIYMQIARPFAAINYGDPELAPRTEWNLEAYEDQKTAAQTMLTLAQALNQFRMSGQKVKNIRALAKTLGLQLKDGWFEEVAPLQVEAKAAGATGSASEKEDSDDDLAGDGAPKGDEPLKEEESR